MAMKTLSVMKLTGTFLCTLFSTLLWLGNAEAGQVVVRDASEPFDAFAVRDELLRQHEWQELLRSQQQLEILRSLPAICVPYMRPYRYFSCDGHFYRPYLYRQQQLYIGIPKPGFEVIAPGNEGLN